MLSLTLPGNNVTVDDPTGFKYGNASIGGVVFDLIPYALGFAGMILFVIIIWGGFQVLTAAGNQDKLSKGKMLITSGLIGFSIVFSAYWIMQIIQEILGVGLGFGS